MPCSTFSIRRLNNAGQPNDPIVDNNNLTEGANFSLEGVGGGAQRFRPGQGEGFRDSREVRGEGIRDYQKVRGEGFRDFKKVRGEGFTEAFGSNWKIFLLYLEKNMLAVEIMKNQSGVATLLPSRESNPRPCAPQARFVAPLGERLFWPRF